MLLYLLQRLAVFAATLVVASLIVFAVMNILPGNAAETMLGATATPEAVAALSHKLGLDQPACSPLRPLDRRRRCRAISASPTPMARRSRR